MGSGVGAGSGAAVGVGVGSAVGVGVGSGLGVGVGVAVGSGLGVAVGVGSGAGVAGAAVAGAGAAAATGAGWGGDVGSASSSSSPQAATRNREAISNTVIESLHKSFMDRFTTSFPCRSFGRHKPTAGQACGMDILSGKLSLFEFGCIVSIGRMRRQTLVLVRSPVGNESWKIGENAKCEPTSFKRPSRRMCG